MTTDPQFPPRDRLFALIASIPGSGTVDWCTPARALLDEITAPSAAVSPPPATDRAALSAKLWAVAEHHIVAEWICCEPLEPGHRLCAKGYAALGMAKSLLVDGDPEKAWNPEAPLLNAVLAELEQLRRERDLAIAHDRQPYPTAWAYEQACAALRTHRGRADALEQEVRRLGLMVDEYGAGASALTDKLKRARDMHRETCIAAKGDVSPTAFTCGMCEALDAPAAAVLPPDGRAASYRLAADAIESMQGYPHLILPEEIVAALRLLATGAQPEPGSPAYTRRLAAGERDEQQAQQDGAETRDALMAAHAALAAHAGRQQAVLTRIGQMADHWEQQLPEVIRTPAVVSAIRAALERADTPAAAPATGQPPADTGEEADPLRMSDEPCPGFPDRCPNLRTVEPEPGVHLGGVRCGCADGEARP